MSQPEPTEQIKLRDPAFVVQVDKHKMTAHLAKVEGAEWQYTEGRFAGLISALAEAGLVELDLNGLQKAMPQIVAGEVFCFARGTQPVDGKNGFIEYAFDPNPAEKLWKTEDADRADFRRSQDVNNVKANQLLARSHPTTPGRDGRDVFGSAVAARRGREAKLVAGKDVRLGPDEREAYAEMDGYAKQVRSKILVDTRKVVEGDVDFHTGNIDFHGDVLILGDVKETFSVTVLGNITISGSVDRANLKAGADITVQGGIYGKEGIEVRAEGNVFVGFAENAHVRAGGDIYVRNFLVNCQACAGERIHLKAVGKSLIGGRIKAAHGVVANSLGNPRIPTKTVIEFGLTPEMEQLVRSLTMEYQRADDVRQIEIRRQLEQINDEYQKQNRARVAARHIVYPGVVFVSGKATYEVRHEISAMTFYKVRDRNEISMRAFVPAEKNPSG